MTAKELKTEIRRYRKLKLKCRAGSEERLSLEHRIKDLKKNLADLLKIDSKKEPIIKEIMRYEKCTLFDEAFYNNHTLPDLKKHLEKIRRGK